MMVMRMILQALVSLLIPGLGLTGGEFPSGPVKPVPLERVRMLDEFWRPRMETNRLATLPLIAAQCESEGRMADFQVAGGIIHAPPRQRIGFEDADFYRLAEAAAWSLVGRADAELQAELGRWVDWIGAAQEDDGYLHTPGTQRGGSAESTRFRIRWLDPPLGYELYNAGHLYLAATAHYHATGKRKFLEIACRNADLMARIFHPNGRQSPPGHPVIELGLIQLYRATGEKLYLQLAEFFLEQRGRPRNGEELWGPYFQDHLPVVEQSEAVGHAVRSIYLVSAMTEIAALTGNIAYQRAVDRIWEDVVKRKLYLTGGVGSRGRDRSFGGAYELLNASAVCESCAVAGMINWNHRLFLLHGHGRYMDVLERALYNALPASVSRDGRRFFQCNPLASSGQHERQPRLPRACCPGNLARLIATIPAYFYAIQGDTLFVNLFGASRVTADLEGSVAQLTQHTRYPWDGKVRIELELEKPRTFTLKVRVPGWAREKPVPSELYRFLTPAAPAPRVHLNGSPVVAEESGGYFEFTRTWESGDRLEVDFPMPIRRVVSCDLLTANQGRVALQRGPIVFCVEGRDQRDGGVRHLRLPDNAPLEMNYPDSACPDFPYLTGSAVGYHFNDDCTQTFQSPESLTAIPYFAWANRGPGPMAVWLPREEFAVEPAGSPSLAYTSILRTSGGINQPAIRDQITPESPRDTSIPFFHWWPRKGTVEWVQYEFPFAAEISSVEVYWYDDTGDGDCRTPKEWWILYREGESWIPVKTNAPFGVEKDRYNHVGFETVPTDAIRLGVKLRPGFSTGIYEWKVE